MVHHNKQRTHRIITYNTSHTSRTRCHSSIFDKNKSAHNMSNCTHAFISLLLTFFLSSAFLQFLMRVASFFYDTYTYQRQYIWIRSAKKRKLYPLDFCSQLHSFLLPTSTRASSYKTQTPVESSKNIIYT